MIRYAPSTESCGDVVPRKGATIYSAYGDSYEFGEALTAERWLIYPIVYIMGWDGEEEKETLDRPLVGNPKHYYPKPPRAVVERETSEAVEVLLELQKKIADARAEFRTFELEEKARQARMARHEKLTRLDDYITGRISHVIVESGDDWSILTWKDMIKHRDGVRLLSLFGKSNGDLTWRVSDYTDYSSKMTEVAMFATEDEAKTRFHGMLDDAFEKWRAGDSTLFQKAVATCNKFGIPLPDDVVASCKKAKIASALRNYEASRDSMVKSAETLHRVMEDDA